MLQYNSHDPFYKNPIGPVKTGDEVTLRIKYNGQATPVLRTWISSEQTYPMYKIEDDVYECKFNAPKIPCQLWYSFVVEDDNDILYYGNSHDVLGGLGQIYNTNFHSYLLVVYDENYKTPDYLHKGNIYQIFPDRFFKGNYVTSKEIGGRTVREWHKDPLLNIDSKNGDNYAHDFFMGNLRGIIEKLDYLYDLGIRTIYMNPIFKAGTNHRYDTGDYNQIDPYLGNEDELKALYSECKKRDMHLILDGVFSHTGFDSKYFNGLGTYDSLGAYQSTDSPYFDWYIFKNYPDSYNAWWGIYTLPEINKHSQSYKDFILNKENGVASSWIKKGAAGWRLDVADELPMDFLRELRSSIKHVNSDAILLGEVWEDASNKVAYEQTRCYCLGDTLDSVMNYPLRLEIINFLTHRSSAYSLAKLLLHQREVYPIPFLYALMNLIGSHDRARILNVFANEEHLGEDRAYCKHVKLSVEQYQLAYNRYIQAVALLTALPGSPTIYYGDEAGMQGTADPWNRRTYPWGYEDNSLKVAIKDLLNQRLNTTALQTGEFDVLALDDNTIQITRSINNEIDVFGNKAKNAKVVFTLNRNDKNFNFDFE